MPGQRPSDVLTAWVSHTTKALAGMCQGSQLLLASRRTRILAASLTESRNGLQALRGSHFALYFELKHRARMGAT